MAGTIISGVHTTGITLSSTASNPVAVTGTITVANGVALYGEGGGTKSWTIANSGTIISSGTPFQNAIYLGSQSSYVTNAIVTNQSGGKISATGYGVFIWGPGSVTNQSGGTISGGLQGIYVIDTGTVVNAGVILGPDNGAVYVHGGMITNLATGTIAGSEGVRINGVGTVVNAGTITGTASNGSVLFDSTTGSSRLIVDPGAVFNGIIQSLPGSTNTLELASAASAGTLSGFNGSGITNFATLQFDTGAKWTVDGNTAASGLGTIAITGFGANDTIDLAGFAAVSETFASNALVLTNAATAHATLHVQGTFTSASFHLASDGSGGTDITVICFITGTMIGTPAGEVPVQKLKAGDMVSTAHNGPRRVVWVGKGNVLSTRGRRTAATPVIVRKGALADNVPNQDLHVTKAHSLYLDGVLIPVEFLVNHRTIIWDDRAQEVEIYHVELESHDVLLANGAPAESYRDDGNRWLFQNANESWAQPPQDPYAPVLTGGPVVDAAWRRLLDRAGPRALPPLTDDPDLHLVVDGTRVDPEYRRGSLYGFRLPSSPKGVVIASRVGAPSELGIARDPRPLGVALRQLTVRQGAKFMLLNADDDRLTVGFHAYEADGHLRWTDGRAQLPAAAFARFDQGAEVTLHLGGATQYLDAGDEAEIRAAYGGLLRLV
ncbi:Hint domain-containing protein [Acidisphaera sp. S103]|uniref:Hint domain-containing protein n=1 Tax=Acidisphaera sp. S103 TaxID=1747223 RepID=UPI00131B309B|nr:Hint domain-containing protein [Acidisphaera sp. S103]